MKRAVLPFLIISFLFLPLINTSEFSNVNAYTSTIDVHGAYIVIDLTRNSYHDELVNFQGNLSTAYNQVIVCNSELTLPDYAGALVIPDIHSALSPAEKDLIKDWLELGDKLLFIGGDSDYGGFFSSTHTNDLLEYLGTQIYLDGTSISDATYNDGASYRTAPNLYGNSTLATTLSEGCVAGIQLHGPGSVLGYNGTDYVDLRTESLPNVDVLLSYSENSHSDDSDVSNGDLDLYAGETGYFPAVVYEKMINSGAEDSHVILAGECLFADYKFMYEQRTENGVYNGGIHYGMKFVDNIINHFVRRNYFKENFLYVDNNADLDNYGFPGNGSTSNPYIIENLDLKNTMPFGILIKGISKDIRIENCVFEGHLNSIVLDDINTGKVIIFNNTLSESSSAISVSNSISIDIHKNRFYSNDYAVLLFDSEDCRIVENNITYSQFYGVSMDLFSTGNQVYHNNFYNNSHVAASQAKDDGSGNVWYETITKRGNFWNEQPEGGKYDIDGLASSQDIYALTSAIVIDYGSGPEIPTLTKTNASFITPLIILILVMCSNRSLLSRKKKRKT